MLTAPLRLQPNVGAMPSDAEADLATLAAELIRSRRTVLPKRLGAPGPNAVQQQTMLEAAASAPDHGQLLPWRFVVVPQSARAALGEVFAEALIERDPEATPEQRAQAREKAQRAPWLLLLVVDGACGDPAVDLLERVVSAGCAVQNLLLMATALGFGSSLTSGKALSSRCLKRMFHLSERERALCFVSVGTVLSIRPGRARPDVTDFVSTLGDPSISQY